tara:strand:+ start:681 stop:2084 length:1404 start_codon:yes stop_codon:yes gene_type:complete
MTLIKNTTTGRYDTNANEVMDHIRKPVFVDNAVHHARLSIQKTGKQKITIEKKNTRNVQVMPENEYEIVEGESGIQLTLSTPAGHNSDSVPFFNGERITTANRPLLVYNADATHERLVISTIESNSIGVFANLKNLKGKTLTDIGFSGERVRLGQPLDVGMRTSDLAIKLAESIASGVTSVGLSRPRNTTATNRKNHSTRFIGQDFHNTNLMTALRFLGRHDSRMVLLDRFGNLLYIPITFSESSVNVSSTRRLGAKKETPVDNSSNRVTVQGTPMALNDLVIVTVDDGEGQVDDIRENTLKVIDHTARNTNAARRIARQILRGSALTKGKITSEGHPHITHIRPGMSIKYGGQDKIVTEVVHRPLENMSDISLLNLETGIEGVLQSITEGTTVESSEENPVTFVQIVETNLALFGKLELRIQSSVVHNTVHNTAILIGGVKGTKNRGLIGRNGLPVGTNKGHRRVN